MKKIILLNLILFLVLALLNSLSLTAQDKENTTIDKMVLVFQGNHITLNVAMLSCKKARLNNNSGSHPIITKAAPGTSLGFKYKVNFNKEYSLTFGPQAIIAGRNFITLLNKDDFSPPLTANYNLSFWQSFAPDLIFNFPVVFEKRVFYNKKKYLFADLGISLNYSWGADFYLGDIIIMDTNNNFYNAGGLDVNANNEQNPWISYPIQTGHAWLLKNNNLFQVSLCANISFTKYVDGSYEINIPGKPLTTGKYSSTGSYIGLSVNYVFTNANYRIRKAYEKK